MSTLANRTLGLVVAFSHLWAGLSAATTVVPVDENFPIAVDLGVEIQGKPGVAFDGASFLVVWSHLDAKAIYGARVSWDGVVLDDPPLPISVGTDTSNRHATVGWDGANFLAVWVAERSVHSGVGEIYASRITPQGAILDPVGIRLTTGANAKVRMVGLGFDGTNYLIVWRTTANTILGTRVSPAGVNLDAPIGFSICGTSTSYYPSVAFDGTNYMAVWHDSRNGAYDMWAARITPGGVTLDPNGFRVTDEPTYQEHGTIAFDGAGYQVQWYERGPGADAIQGSSWAARVSPDGTVLDTSPFPLFAHTRGQIPVQAACDGSECVVVASWPQDLPRNFRLEDVYARRVSQQGVVVNPRGIPVSTEFWHQFGPVIGYGAGRYLVAWGDRRKTPSIWAQLLEVRTPAGTGTTDAGTKLGGPPSVEPPLRATSTWTREVTPIRWAADGLAFSTTDSYAFGDGAFHTTGDAWVLEDARSNLFGAWASGPDDIWVAGWARCFLHWDGGTWSLPSCNGSGGRDTANGVWGSTPDAVWATCDQGDLLNFAWPEHWNWNWDTVSTPVDASLWDLWGAAGDDIWAVGSAGTVISYDGASWKAHPSKPTNQGLSGVWGNRTNDIFAVGDWGTIVHYDGVAWSEQPSGTSEHLFDVWGVSDGDVYAVGDGGTILRYDGLTWQAEVSGTSQDLLAVWGHVEPDGAHYTIWAAGLGNLVLKKTVKGPLVFSDGFESGDTLAWSSSRP